MCVCVCASVLKAGRCGWCHLSAPSCTATQPFMLHTYARAHVHGNTHACAHAALWSCLCGPISKPENIKKRIPIFISERLATQTHASTHTQTHTCSQAQANGTFRPRQCRQGVFISFKVNGVSESGRVSTHTLIGSDAASRIRTTFCFSSPSKICGTKLLLLSTISTFDPRTRKPRFSPG